MTKKKQKCKAIRFIAALILILLLASCAPVGDIEITTSAPTASLFPDVTDSPDQTEGHPPQAGSTGEAPASSTAPESTEPPRVINIPLGEIEAPQTIIYDVSAHRALYMQNSVIDGKVYPASTTKLWSAYIALQYLTPETVITAGDELSLVEKDSSIAYIKKGHKLTAEMLVEAMLLPSGGDAAYVLSAAAGKKILGNANVSPAKAIDAFVGELNRCLTHYGFTSTHFVTPDGYHHPDHYTSLEDIAQMAALALSDPTIKKYVMITEERVVYASGESNKWRNTNELIHPESEFYCKDAIGLKTGSTDEAGYCVITAARDADGKLYIIGVYGGTTKNSRFADAKKLIEYALNK